MNAIIRLARAEARKLLTTRALPVSVGVAVALTLMVVLVNAAVAGQRGLPPLGTQGSTYQMLKLGAVTSVVMLVLGILSSGGEFRHKTIVPALLATPRRGQVFAVKTMVIAVAGAIFGGSIFGLGLVTAKLSLEAHGIGQMPGPVGVMYAGTVLSSVCFGMIGVALGALTRNTVTAIIAAIGWALVVEQVVLQAVVPGLEKWLPVGASIAMTSPPGAAELPPATGALALAGYALALLLVASRTSIQRDIG